MPYKTKPAFIAYVNENEVADELYKNVVQASYSYAVQLTRNIDSSGHGPLITKVVLRLAQQNNENLLSYVYQLWKNGERGIIENYMPKSFKLFFSDSVLLISNMFGLALKMDARTDSDGDRMVWGDASDKSSLRVKWELIPFWENNRVFFHILNKKHGMFIKLEIHPDDVGDRGAFGSSDSGTAGHEWILEPVVVDRMVLFYITNRQFHQGLKLHKSADHMGDRKLFGHNGSVYSDPRNFAWSIEINETNDSQLSTTE